MIYGMCTSTNVALVFTILNMHEGNICLNAITFSAFFGLLHASQRGYRIEVAGKVWKKALSFVRDNVAKCMSSQRKVREFAVQSA